MKRKVVIAITGASGAIYAKRMLEILNNELIDQISDIAIVLSENANIVWKEELGEEFTNSFNNKLFASKDFYAPFASGSANYDTMIIVPCSMGTLGRIATGISNDLITRAADVILKEQRKLVLMVRETPFNLIHVENMRKIILAGGLIFPAIPSFYNKPKSMEQLIDDLVKRLLSFSGFEIEIKGWSL